MKRICVFKPRNERKGEARKEVATFAPPTCKASGKAKENKKARSTVAGTAHVGLAKKGGERRNKQVKRM